ncbi:hypothetical protein FHR70_000677 [Microvirga lupini]|uniref:Uncharacterized protein n=1 Tax=Microvirga lupini TaxID=420324 RepID=A0A7W4VIB0_9HYPH|nr:hypothetical protein [Microvirga lupini]MBB3017637.1 hypothetical protein [Microvirga lupini]
MVEYFTLEELPDRPMFRCERRNATLQVSACAGMWSEANGKAAPERLDRCKNCPLGAKHAGVGEISLSPLRGMSICARCHQGTTRLIRKHLCVSCYNREREFNLGRNAKGSAPVKHPPLHNIEIRYQAGEVLQRLAMPVVSSEELVVAALRDTSKQVTFAFSGKRPEMPQGELFV